MIGPGTGIAPFRGFIQERSVLQKSAALGKALLFFGCRHPEQDYLYEEELKASLEQGVLHGLFTAFSRAHAKKEYVQHLMLENAKTLWELLSRENAHLYVCGYARVSLARCFSHVC